MASGEGPQEKGAASSSTEAPSAPPLAETHPPNYVPYTGHHQYSQVVQPPSTTHYQQQSGRTSRPEYWQAETPPQSGYLVTGSGGYEYQELSGEYGYDRPLACCGCGIGWFLSAKSGRGTRAEQEVEENAAQKKTTNCFHYRFIFGFFFNLLWYVGAILWFFPHNPRERPGLTANLVAACISGAFALGIVAYLVGNQDQVMALWATYKNGELVLNA